MPLAFISREQPQIGDGLSLASPGLYPGDRLEVELPSGRRLEARVIETHRGRLRIELDGRMLQLRTPYDDGEEREGYAPARTEWRISAIEPLKA